MAFRRAVARSTGDPASAVLLWVGIVLLAAVTLLVVLLAVLPGHRPFLASTISAAAYGSQATLVFAVLLLFGLATAAMGASLAMRLRGGAGIVCGLLVAVWAAASMFDAFVRTESRAHTGTVFGQVHTLAAVAGIVAQASVALAYLALVRSRLGQVPGPLVSMTAVVLAAVVFVAVHPNALAGLSERLLLAASAMWMIVSVRAAPPLLPPGEGTSTGPQP